MGAPDIGASIIVMFSGTLLIKLLKKAGDKVELIISIFWVFTLKSPFLPSQSSTV